MVNRWAQSSTTNFKGLVKIKGLAWHLKGNGLSPEFLKRSHFKIYIPYSPTQCYSVTLNETKRKCFFGTIFPLVPKNHFLLVSISVSRYTMRGNTIVPFCSIKFFNRQQFCSKCSINRSSLNLVALDLSQCPKAM